MMVNETILDTRTSSKKEEEEEKTKTARGDIVSVLCY